MSNDLFTSAHPNETWRTGMPVHSRVLQFLAQQQLDIRQTHNGRFMDQKCTPDVVSAVAECICYHLSSAYLLNMQQGSLGLSTEYSVAPSPAEMSLFAADPLFDHNYQNWERNFTARDIWQSSHASEFIRSVFGKPDLDNETTRSEYDKFFAQPIKLLASAGVLQEIKTGHKNLYHVVEPELLQWIAQREQNALFFLSAYLKQSLEQSGLIENFWVFYEAPNANTLANLRQTMLDFYQANTNITGKLESDRILNKIINIIACTDKQRGVEKGAVSSQVITIDKIRYNNINFRDINKDKSMSRNEFAQQHAMR